MKHLVLVGACYLDTILRQAPPAPPAIRALIPSSFVPHYPEEDSKLRATGIESRRGGNCPNSLEVLQQLLDGRPDVRLYLVSCLPDRASPAAERVVSSFGARSGVDFRHCIYRRGHAQAASSYIIRSVASGSRTIVNYNDLPEMTTTEFARIVDDFSPDDDAWWHFEGRIPDTTIECVRLLRRALPSSTVSVEVEKPGRPGLPELAAEADVVFYSRTWAEKHVSQRSNDEVEGDTFIAGMLYSLACRPASQDLSESLAFAVRLATLKVQREGFDNLAADIEAGRRSPATDQSTALR
ncbi:GTPase-activating protein GYP7 [Purpureocillium lavendulum]|uniref:GTPase-activating protein GYP7 n=1 Tax=Purpureocillium lavendulum TaxID=1247861 RepID=A0AB34FIS0_9HYPO|nr:GTPase-activating protein GYP7 [Purpureocillium lavendulum]